VFTGVLPPLQQELESADLAQAREMLASGLQGASVKGATTFNIVLIGHGVPRSAAAVELHVMLHELLAGVSFLGLEVHIHLSMCGGLLSSPARERLRACAAHLGVTVSGFKEANVTTDGARARAARFRPCSSRYAGECAGRDIPTGRGVRLAQAFGCDYCVRDVWPATFNGGDRCVAGDQRYTIYGGKMGERVERKRFARERSEGRAFAGAIIVEVVSSNCSRCARRQRPRRSAMGRRRPWCGQRAPAASPHSRSSPSAGACEALSPASAG